MDTTRRFFLGSLAAASLPVSVTVAKTSTEAVTIEDFLARSTPAERVRYHANALAEAMAEMHPHLSWRSEVDHEYHFVLTTGDERGAAR